MSRHAAEQQLPETPRIDNRDNATLTENTLRRADLH
jgi:hypothetical protein